MWWYALKQYGEILLQKENSETDPCPEELWNVTKEILSYGQIFLNTNEIDGIPHLSLYRQTHFLCPV